MGVKGVFGQNKRQGCGRKTEHEGECFWKVGVSFPKPGRWRVLKAANEVISVVLGLF